MLKWKSVDSVLIRPTVTERSIRVVIGSLERGGAETHLSRILPLLCRRGWKIRVLTLTEKGDLAPALEGAGVPVESICGAGATFRQPRFVSRFRRAMLVMANLYSEFRRDGGTITWFLLPESYLLGMTAALFARMHGAVVMSRRSLNDYQEKYFGSRWLERQYHKRAFLVLGNSSAVIRQLHDEEGVPKSKLRLIYGAVETDSYRSKRARAEVRADIGLRDSTFLIVIVANLIPYKGHRDLFEALHIANERLSDDWSLICVGSRHAIDRGEYADNLELLARKLDIASRVLLLGTRDDVPNLLGAADLGLLTSHEESFSNALLEYMAAGLPVISTDVGGSREAVINGETGILVPPRCSKELADAIVYFANNTEARRRFGAAGRRRVSREFSLDTCVECYDQLFLAISRGFVPPAREDLTLQPPQTAPF
jgi:glycosyltransferase involved in cell wall biosynthesis